jgi:hypothetical protein
VRAVMGLGVGRRAILAERPGSRLAQPIAFG